MAGAWATIGILDGAGGTRTMRVWDESGSGAGPFLFGHTFADGTGVGSALNTVNGSGADVEVVPAVTVGAYTAGWVIGGIMTFANVLPASFKGILNSITLKFKATAQTVEFDVAIFAASPAGTFGDHAAPAIAAADSAILLGIYQMIGPQSGLGTHAVYNLDGIGKQIVGISTSLFAVVIAKAAPVNPASVSDMSLRLGMVW